MDERPTDVPTPAQPHAPEDPPSGPGDVPGGEPSSTSGRRPQSPASKGMRGGLFVALAAALLALAANDSWLLPSLDEDGVVYLYAASSLARSGEVRVPVAHWSANDSVSGLGARTAVLPEAMAVLTRRGARNHVAALWLLAASLALLTLSVAWVSGGASGVEGGLLAGALLLFSPLALEAATALRPEALAAALAGLQLGLMAYRPRWYPAHGAAGALVWAVHPAGAGAVAAAALWPFLPDVPPLGPHLAGKRNARGVRTRVLAAGGALLPALALLFLGPGVAGLPSVPAVLGRGLTLAPLEQLVGWAGAGVSGLPGMALGLVVLAGGATLVLLEAVTTAPVDPTIPWHHRRAPDLVANRARAAAWLLALGLALGAVVAGQGAELERSGLLAVTPLAALFGLAVTRWITRAPERHGWLLTGIVASWFLVSGWNALDRSREIQQDGRGVTTTTWLESATIQWLDNELPPELEIYASAPHMVLIQTARAARTLPPEGTSLDAFAEHFLRRPGVVVLTGADATRAPAFMEALGAVSAVQGEEGSILVPAGSPAR